MKVNRHTVLISAGLLVAAIAAVWGTLLATGQGGDGGRTPEGKANALRLEAASSEVACDGGRAEVFVYLDDLVPRPSPDNAAVSFGLVGFELPVQYDPSIVRLIAPNEVVLNPLLGQQDIDGDGVLRAFLPVHSVNDEAGQAMIGAASYVPSSSEVADNQEEGIDPVAKGEPLLLMTLRFMPVGAGTTVIKIEPWTTGTEQPGLADPALGRYENLQFQQTSLTVRGGDCPLPPTPLPTLTPPPTPAPPTPLPTAVPWRTVEAPDAASTGRSDCPADWVVFTDPEERYSICYPEDFVATASDFALNIVNPRNPDEPGTLNGVVVSWQEFPFFRPDVTQDERCAELAEPAAGPDSAALLVAEVANQSAPACLIEGYNVSLLGDLPLASDGSGAKGFIHFGFFYTSPDEGRSFSDGFEILGTLKVVFR